MKNKTVLLISANEETLPAPVYPLALARLAGALERAGHAARQFDLLAHGREALAPALLETKPDLLAVSLRNVDNTDAEAPRSYLPSVRQLVATLRRHSNAPLVLGGSGFSLFPRPILAMLDADFGIIGPGEAALCALANGHDPVDIPGLVTSASPSSSIPRNGQMANGAGEWESWPTSHQPDLVDYYWREGGMIGVQTKRGCPRTCSYCTYPLLDGGVVRRAGPRAVAEDMARLFRDHGVHYFFIADSVFNLNAEEELALADELRRLALPIQWGAFFAPTGTDRAYWAALQQSGLTHVELGTDSLCDAMLDAYAKGFTVADAVRTTQVCGELGLKCAHYLLLGGPGETPDTLRETAANAGRLARCVLFPFAGVRIYPGTALHAQARREGRVREEDDCLDPKFYFAEGLDAPLIWRTVAEAATGGREWVLPSRTPRLAPMMRHLRRSGRKGPLWEFLLQ